MKLSIGTRVAYSVQFLKSIGMSHGDMAHARGTITALKELSPECVLASVEWEKGADMPGKVNTKNLSKVGPNARFANCG